MRPKVTVQIDATLSKDQMTQLLTGLRTLVHGQRAVITVRLGSSRGRLVASIAQNPQGLK